MAPFAVLGEISSLNLAILCHPQAHIEIKHPRMTNVAMMANAHVTITAIIYPTNTSVSSSISLGGSSPSMSQQTRTANTPINNATSVPPILCTPKAPNKIDESNLDLLVLQATLAAIP